MLEFVTNYILVYMCRTMLCHAVRLLPDVLECGGFPTEAWLASQNLTSHRLNNLCKFSAVSYIQEPKAIII